MKTATHFAHSQQEPLFSTHYWRARYGSRIPLSGSAFRIPPIGGIPESGRSRYVRDPEERDRSISGRQVFRAGDMVCSPELACFTSSAECVSPLRGSDRAWSGCSTDVRPLRGRAIGTGRLTEGSAATQPAIAPEGRDVGNRANHNGQSSRGAKRIPSLVQTSS
jgi:hypothetical protein